MWSHGIAPRGEIYFDTAAYCSVALMRPPSHSILLQRVFSAVGHNHHHAAGLA
jgi:hypothetical protein